MDASTISEAQEPIQIPAPLVALPPKRVDVPAPGLYLDVSRFDHLWDDHLGTYTTQEHEHGQSDREQNPGDGYAFSIVRCFTPVPGRVVPSVVTLIEFRSPYFINVAKEVMKEGRTLSWSSDPVTFRVHFLLGYFSRFEKYYQDLEASASYDEETSYTLEHLSFFLKFFRNEFGKELHEYNQLVAQGLITWSYIWALLTPGLITLHVEINYVQPALQAMRLIDISTSTEDGDFSIRCEYLQREEKRIGLAEWTYKLSKFEGTMKIVDLEVFPLSYHPKAQEIERTLIERGLKWYRLGGVQHKYYEGLAVQLDGNDTSRSFEVKSRIILDQERYIAYSTLINFQIPQVVRTVTGETRPFNSDMYDPSVQPPDSALMMAPTFLYGFSLANKAWYLFGVDDIHDIQWDDTAFDHLALPAPQKELIISLVESYKQHGSAAIDDFVEGKGLGLILSLFGPPGVGKTLTAEVTSEHTRSPLYIVGADEIGVDAGALELNLPRIFTLASAWNAVVLLDEAEVFLEQRSTSDLGRNALVAVLLRQLEYFPGILFLTTNRQVVFDKALQSRIHISIYYSGLTPDAKRSVWKSFLSRAGQPNWPDSVIRKLISFDLNGRQIKNVVNTANILAKEAKEDLNIDHVLKVILVNERNAIDALQRHAKKWASIFDALLLGLVVVIPLTIFFLFLYDPVLSSLWRIRMEL